MTDFDGTLAEIVTDPGAARPVDGAVTTLATLAVSYATVGVVSGRTVAYLERILPPVVHLSGLYGLESSHLGVRAEHPDAARWRPVIERVAAEGRQTLPVGAAVEPKGLSVTVHYRRAPTVASAVAAWAERASASTGLVVRAAKQSLELHPPVDADKGTVARELIGGLSRACFLGDDVGDLAAFAALSALGAAGCDVLNVAVGSTELAPDVSAAADAVVDGPAGALAFLRTLEGAEAQPAASS